MPEPPVDELPRSVVTDPHRRPPETESGRGGPGRGLVWLILAVIVVVVFVAALWVLNPPSERIGQGAADVVVTGPPNS